MSRLNARLPRLTPLLVASWLVTGVGCSQLPPASVRSGGEDMPRFAGEPCRRVMPRVPAALADLEWVRSAGEDRHVFAGEAFPESAERSFNDPDSAGSTWLQLREIDLDGDGDCDLVGRATVALSSAGDADGHLVVWWADDAAWRRDGPQPDPQAVDQSDRSRELAAPRVTAEYSRFGFGSYVPAHLREGGLLLLVRARPGRGNGDAPPVAVLGFDGETKALVPRRLAEKKLAALHAWARKHCEEPASVNDGCASW